VIKVSIIAVDRQGQAVRLKSMSIDEDFLGLAPEMLGFTEKLVNLSKSFVGNKFKGQTLIDGLNPPQQEAQPIKWASLALGGKRKSLAQQGNSRGPLKRGRTAPTRRKSTKPRMNLDEKGQQATRRDEEDPEAERAARVDRRAADREARETRRAERSTTRPDPRRSRGKARASERDVAEPPARRKRTRSRSRGARAQIDEWGVGTKPRRLRKRSRSRVNWPLIAGASVVGAGVIGGGFALWYSLAATPSAVNASVTWSTPE